MLPVSPFSETLLYGRGLFETIGVVGGVVRFWTFHLDRLLAGASDLGFSPPERVELTNEVTSILRRSLIADARLKMLLFHDGATTIPRRLIQISDPPTTAISDVELVLTDVYRTVPSTRVRRKTTSYLDELLVQRHASEVGAFDGIMLASDGTVAEGGRSNLFFLRDEMILTPPESCGLLPGVGRRGILERAGRGGVRVDERSLHVNELPLVEGAVAVNALRGPIPVSRIVSTKGEAIAVYDAGSRRLAEMLRVPFEAAGETSSIRVDE